MTNPKANAVLVEALGSSLRYGGSALNQVPDLLEQILDEEAWREFTTPRGELARHEVFDDFVITPPTKGLGASMALIERIIGTDRPELLRKLRDARKRRPGRPRKGEEKTLESKGISWGTADHEADRLAREAPDEYEAVKRSEKTIHAAAVAAGIRKRRVSVRLDDAESAARTLRKHMSPDTRRTLARLLLEEEDA